jgi:hypothetical protein
MKTLLIYLFFITSLFGNLHDKSAIVYYGDDISYSYIGIHDYIIIQPKHVDTSTHGFQLYKDKLYAYVSIGEIEKNDPAYTAIDKKWIVTKNKTWNSDVLDIANKQYQEFIFTHQIEPLLKKGFVNFFFDTLDSYHLYTKTQKEKALREKALASFINTVHKRYPKAKIILNRGFEIIDAVHDSITAVLFESYYKGLQGKDLNYCDISNNDRAWLDAQIATIKKYNLDIIAVDYLPYTQKQQAQEIVKKLQKKGFIPYVATKELTSYGITAKNAIKREILTIIDESRLDRILQEAHQHGGTVLQYLGYKQKLYNIAIKPFPDPKKLTQYTGVIIWLQDYVKDTGKYLQWLQKMQKAHIPIIFVNNFGFNANKNDLAFLGINISQGTQPVEKILYQDTIVGYEAQPSLENITNQIHLSLPKSKKLLTYKCKNGATSTPAAITPWGGYIVNTAYMFTVDGENLWVTDPFAFFTQALHLQKLPAPDPTTLNGNRLFFTHIDGDGFVNVVEGTKNKFSAEEIYDKILKHYKIPHSVSVIGAEVEPTGLFPQYANRIEEIAKKIFSLPNVEGATHTFTHPFKWGKVHNNTLDPKYRLKPKNYTFSFDNELKKTLQYINKHFVPKGHKQAQAVFWSGDCAPRVDALSFVYKHNILNINGGDTTITKTAPWLSLIAPYGLERNNFYQIYTGQQNENIYTNDWLGPFWGFKRVVETYELTDTPRRFKPIDIYYHLYSGSKLASIKALKYVFDWVLQQKYIFPIYTSEYIPQVQDFFDVSMANEADQWLVSGLKDLKTLRIDATLYPHTDTNDIISITKHNDAHYFSFDAQETHYFTLKPYKQKIPYVVHANAFIEKSYTKDTTQLHFKAYVPLQITLDIPKGYTVKWSKKPTKIKKKNNLVHYSFTQKQVHCRIQKK